MTSNMNFVNCLPLPASGLNAFSLPNRWFRLSKLSKPFSTQRDGGLTTHSTGLAISKSLKFNVDCSSTNSGVRWYLMMNMKSLIVVFILFWLAAGTTLAQSPAKAEFKIRGKGQQLILTYQRREHKLNVSEQIDAAKLTDVALLLTSRRESHLYLVVAACGASKLKSDDRQCGAGTECNLLWIKVNSEWRIVELNSVRYESCWLPITSSEGYKITGSNLELVYEDLRQKLSYRVTYNAEQAERGFQVEKHALEDVP